MNTPSPFRPYRLRELYRDSPTSIAVGVVMLLLAAGCLVGLAIDPRQLGGVPVWLKPLKFAISTVLYAFTFPWLLLHLDGHARFKKVVEPVTALVLLVEVVLITAQAARGVQSHFNVATLPDMIVYNVMGAGIWVLWILQVWTAVLLLRQRFESPLLAWSLRLALVLTVLGSSVGFLMVAPRGPQIAQFKAGHPTRSGAHSVGGEDGGPGLPLTGWSLDHGDLRAAHFIGLHALQLLPIAGLLATRSRRLSRRKQVLLVQLTGASYFGLFVLLLGEALAGVSVASGATAVALAFWAAATLGAFAAISSQRNHTAEVA